MVDRVLPQHTLDSEWVACATEPQKHILRAQIVQRRTKTSEYIRINETRKRVECMQEKSKYEASYVIHIYREHSFYMVPRIRRACYFVRMTYWYRQSVDRCWIVGRDDSYALKCFVFVLITDLNVMSQIAPHSKYANISRMSHDRFQNSTEFVFWRYFTLE